MSNDLLDQLVTESESLGLYASMGVDVSEADRGIENIAEQIKSTWPVRGIGRVMLDLGHFANVVDIGNGLGLASTTDGVGSKTIIADLMKIWHTIGIDCVAMNVNDLICIGATPISMLDYIGVEKVDAKIIGQIAIGLAEGARQAGISISGGEISQLPDNIRGFDLVGMAYGTVPMDQMILGKEIETGDALIGIGSNGLHSNGTTMARRVLLEKARLDPFIGRTELSGRSIGEELLRPTFIYVKEILDLIRRVDVRGMVNITGDGLLNLLRLDCHYGFNISWLPPLPDIFTMIKRYGAINDATMFETFNMGIGFCVVVPPRDVDRTIEILQQHGREAWQIGYARSGKVILLPHSGLVGKGKKFEHLLGP